MENTEIKKYFSFQGHDIFLIPSKNGTYLFYTPTLKLLIRITKNLATELSLINLQENNSQNNDISYIADLLTKSLKNSITPFPIQNRKSNFFHLALGLTKNCSLNCLYCHADAGQTEEMSDEIILSSLKYAFETAQEQKLRRVNISFAVGGEPTTNWNKFKFCIYTIKEFENKFSIPSHLSMTTNGYYGTIKRTFIAKYFNSILLSLDGMPDIQNLHRPNRAMKESYNYVRKSALFFIQNVKSFSMRSTISNYSVKRMPEIVEFFFKEFGNKYHLIFEPLVPLGRANTDNIVSEPSQEDFVKFYIEAKEKGKQLGIEIRTSASNQKRLVTGFCGAMTIPSFTVTTKGIITTCERDSDGENYWFGNFSSATKKFIFDDVRKDNNKSLIKIPQKCDVCFCKWHCAGDCPDVRTINYDRCYVNKNLIQYELESLLQ